MLMCHGMGQWDVLTWKQLARNRVTLMSLLRSSLVFGPIGCSRTDTDCRRIESMGHRLSNVDVPWDAPMGCTRMEADG